MNLKNANQSWPQLLEGGSTHHFWDNFQSSTKSGINYLQEVQMKPLILVASQAKIDPQLMNAWLRGYTNLVNWLLVLIEVVRLLKGSKSIRSINICISEAKPISTCFGNFTKTKATAWETCSPFALSFTTEVKVTIFAAVMV